MTECVRVSFKPLKARSGIQSSGVRIAEFSLYDEAKRVISMIKVNAPKDGTELTGEEPQRAFDNNSASAWRTGDWLIII